MEIPIINCNVNVTDITKEVRMWNMNYKSYSMEEIENELGYEIEKKHTECDVLKLSELRRLFESGWVIYDTQTTSDKNIKILTLVKASAQ